MSDQYSSFDIKNCLKFGKGDDGATKSVSIIEMAVVSELQKTLKGLLSIVLVNNKDK